MLVMLADSLDTLDTLDTKSHINFGHFGQEQEDKTNFAQITYCSSSWFWSKLCTNVLRIE